MTDLEKKKEFIVKAYGFLEPKRTVYFHKSYVGLSDWDYARGEPQEINLNYPNYPKTQEAAVDAVFKKVSEMLSWRLSSIAAETNLVKALLEEGSKLA